MAIKIVQRLKQVALDLQKAMAKRIHKPPENKHLGKGVTLSWKNILESAAMLLANGPLLGFLNEVLCILASQCTAKLLKVRFVGLISIQ